jgi:hypothetical protein
MRLTMVEQSAQVKTRVSTPVSVGSMLGTTRISLIRTSHFGQCGSLIRTPWSAPDCGGKIIHTRSCNLSVSLNTTSPGQSRGGAGASLLTADRLSWRVDLLTRLIYVPLGDSA